MAIWAKVEKKKNEKEKRVLFAKKCHKYIRTHVRLCMHMCMSFRFQFDIWILSDKPFGWAHRRPLLLWGKLIFQFNAPIVMIHNCYFVCCCSRSLTLIKRYFDDFKLTGFVFAVVSRHFNGIKRMILSITHKCKQTQHTYEGERNYQFKVYGMDDLSFQICSTQNSIENFHRLDWKLAIDGCE